MESAWIINRECDRILQINLRSHHLEEDVKLRYSECEPPARSLAGIIQELLGNEDSSVKLRPSESKSAFQQDRQGGPHAYRSVTLVQNMTSSLEIFVNRSVIKPLKATASLTNPRLVLSVLELSLNWLMVCNFGGLAPSAQGYVWRHSDAPALSSTFSVLFFNCWVIIPLLLILGLFTFGSNYIQC